MAKYKNKPHHDVWATMPFSAIGKKDAEYKEARIKAMQKMTEGLAPDAFADEADTRHEDSGTYYSRETIIGASYIGVYEQGEDKK